MNRITSLEPAVAPTIPRLGVITNPHSGRNRHALPRVRTLLAAAPQVHHVVTDAQAAIPDALHRFAAEGIEVIAVNGGDGSVAHVLTELTSARTPYARPPLLCALPGGTTNVTVGDVGIRGRLDTALLRLLAWQHGYRRGARILERPVIGVRSAEGTLRGCGLVFGAGAVVDGIEYWQQSVRARGMRSELSSGVAMVRTLWGMLRGHRNFAQALRVQVEGSPGVSFDGEILLLVVSALERLFLGIHPFWGTGDGALRFTAIERRATRFGRALPSILRGSPLPFVTAANGYHSAMLGALELRFDGGFTLDGELHHVAREDGALGVFDAGRARFLRI